MAGLIDGSYGAAKSEQDAFFETHLKPWAQELFADISVAPSASFYRAVARSARSGSRSKRIRNRCLNTGEDRMSKPKPRSVWIAAVPQRHRHRCRRRSDRRRRRCLAGHGRESSRRQEEDAPTAKAITSRSTTRPTATEPDDRRVPSNNRVEFKQRSCQC
jgi:hypothetical protein